MQPGRNRLLVLLVEDSQDIREVFTLLLRAEGAEVVATPSGREAGADIVFNKPIVWSTLARALAETARKQQGADHFAAA